MLMVDLTTDPMFQDFMNNPDKLVKIRPDRISDDMTEQPSLYSRAFYLWAQARKYTAMCKLSMEMKYASTFRRFREDEKAEKTSEHYVKDDDGYVNAKKNFIEAEWQEMTLRALVDGLEQKKDMLQSLAGILRQEMQTGVRVMEDQQTQRLRQIMLKEEPAKVG
jgi:hypothetical protein